MKVLTSAVVFLIFGIAASAGTIVVAGDTNLGNAINGTNGSPIIPGNSTFFGNLLGAGTHVLIETTPNLDSTETTSQAGILAYYNGLAGVTVTTTATATAANLAGQNLYISLLHDAAYSGAEISAISTFLGGGGTAFFTGEFGTFDTPGDNFLNTALAALGSPMHLDLGNYDLLLHTATGGQIVAGPLTAGITSFGYAATSAVTGGNPVFMTTTGQTFIATSASAAAVPEPSTLSLIGCAGLVLAAWRRRSTHRG